MYCRNCGKEVSDQAVACPGCGVPPNLEKKFCPHCGTAIQANQVLCTKCGVSLAAPVVTGGKDKLTAGLLGIFLGVLGLHKFYLGYNREGIVMLLCSVLVGIVTCGAATGVVSVVGLIEGIVYLIKTDEEFNRIYVQGRKAWF